MKLFARSQSLERRFDREVLPHLDSAYNLARWLLRNEDDANDAVQEACIRAFKSLDAASPQNMRPWFLSIVRNCAINTVRRSSLNGNSFEEEIEQVEWEGPAPEKEALLQCDRATLTAILEDLPLEFREAIVLKEIECLSYKEISAVAGIPIGTVMSRLNRARRRLRQRAADMAAEEWHVGL